MVKPWPLACSGGGQKESDETTEIQVTKSSLGGRAGRGTTATGAIRVAAAAAMLALVGLIAPALAAPPSAADQQCLGCHGMPGLEVPLTGGGTLSVHVSQDSFAQSVHSAIGCTGCHAGISLPGHPAAVQPIASKREFSIATVQVCRTCHTDKFEQWGKSVHAALVSEGNPAAPICTSCHAPHTMIKGAAQIMDTVPCRTCHGAIFTAYAGSVHGILRSGGLTQAPLCFNCHGAHDIDVASAGVGRRDVCLGCHTEAAASHKSWLPNVDLHFGVVSCPVCHVPAAHRTVNLILYNSSTQKEISGPVGMPEFEGLTGATAEPRVGLNPTTLLTLLKALDRPGAEGKTSIRGRLEVSTGVEDHELTFASKAIRECSTCHQQGASAFQSVTVSIAGPSGIPIRYAANKDVLNSGFSVDSIGGFYAIGGTRITLLDVLFVLALLGGIGGPLAHLIARWVFPRFLNRTPHEQRKG
jgi:hypothetical protein